MTTVHQVVRAAIPDADDEIVSFIMWARTPYPFGTVSARSIYKAAATLQRAGFNHVRLCDHCDNRARGPEAWECERCYRALYPEPTP